MLLTRALLAVVALGTIGCVGPRPVTMPEIDIPFLVLEADTGCPLGSASIRVEYQSPAGRTLDKGLFLSDDSGRGRILVKKKVHWLSWSSLYFGGGYMREIVAQASGYQDARLSPYSVDKAIEDKDSLVFILKPIRKMASDGDRACMTPNNSMQRSGSP